MNTARKIIAVPIGTGIYRSFSVSAFNNANHSCKLLVVGGGSGGCAMAAKFTRRLKAKDSVIVLEPSSNHYYQPLWTLVGAGISKMETTRRLEASVLPSAAKWIKDKAVAINPNTNVVQTESGDTIHYEYIVIGVGLEMNYDKIPGLYEALTDINNPVSTIYSPDFCEKTWQNFQDFKGGEAVFTYPDTPIKCPGAPQKITYLADSYFTKTNVRSRSNISYNSCLPVIFGVKKYADLLLKIVERKKICVNYRTVLKKVCPDSREAVFFNADDKTKEMTMRYDMLHVTPPQQTPAFLRENKDIADANGYLDVDKFTLRHTKYLNMYGIGDCTNTPNSKTAAAISKQSYVVEQNLLHTMKNDSPTEHYNGYGACPLVTSYNTCVLAEFLYDGVVWETMPFDQVPLLARESTIAFYMKKDLFPFLYWNFMLKGYYHGPEFVRRIINPFAYRNLQPAKH